ncbi:MAG: peptidoglycan-binding domain-containing protein, partial [Stellaceae bacterium]
AAVKEFQKENGLKQTAHLDSATMKKLSQAGGAGGGMPSGGSITH